ncbi:hypothetical protein L7F22_018445 [Adiantum nelumboides]|nr:hypothetical protein [Adiantum nelumboides]
MGSVDDEVDQHLFADIAIHDSQFSSGWQLIKDTFNEAKFEELNLPTDEHFESTTKQLVLENMGRLVAPRAQAMNSQSIQLWGRSMLEMDENQMVLVYDDSFLRRVGGSRQGLITGVQSKDAVLSHYIRIVKMLEKLLVLVHEKLNDHIRAQLRELVTLNGTIQHDGICPVCGEHGHHHQYDCSTHNSILILMRMDDEYKTFVAKVGGVKPINGAGAFDVGSSVQSARSGTTFVSSTYFSSSIGSLEMQLQLLYSHSLTARPTSRLINCRSALHKGTLNMTMAAQQEPHSSRFAVFLTGHASPFCISKYGGYGQMMVDLLRDHPSETWDILPVVDGIQPSLQQLNSYHGFVITGSKHDAHGNEPWILNLCDILRHLHTHQKKILGICFGHQILSRALGGKTGRAPVGWELGERDVQLCLEAFSKRSFGRDLPSKMRVIESHQDQHLTRSGNIEHYKGCGDIPKLLRDALILERFPAGGSASLQLGRSRAATVVEDALKDALLGDIGGSETFVLPSVGTSRKRARVSHAEYEDVNASTMGVGHEKTPFEIFGVGNHILGIQGHPEFDVDVVMDIIESRAALGVLSEEVASYSKASITQHNPSQKLWQKLCKDFLKN